LHETTRPRQAHPHASGAPERWPAASPAPAPLVPLQQSIGNRAVGRLIQAKLKVGRPGDRLEREADRVADKVMRMPDGAAPAAIAARSTGGEVVGGAEEASPPPAPGTAVQAALRGNAGRPLPPAARAFFEPRLGADLSAVRLHTGPAAGAAAAEIGANAFTHGQSIHFGRGCFAPDSGAGRRLLAHELVHTVQQAGGRIGLIQADFEDDFEGRSEIPASQTQAAPPRTIRLTKPNGEAVWAPYGIYRPSDVPAAYQDRAMESTRVNQSGAKAGRVTVRDIARQTGGRRGPPMDIRVMMARVGNDYRFVGYDTSVAVAGRYVTEGFVESEVGTKLVGRRLFADRVVRALQSGAPEMNLEVHVGPRTAEFHANIFKIIGREGEPQWRDRYQLTPREMMRVALAWSEDLNTTQRSQLAQLAAGASEPTEVDAQRVFRGTPTPGRGGGAPPSPPPAKGGGPGGGSPPAPPTRQGASGSSSPAATPSTGAAQGGTKPVVSARDLAAELARTEREARRLVLTTRAIRFGLGAWQAVSALRDIAKSVNMATAILAQGSPFAAQIQHAETIDSTAKQIAARYNSIDLLEHRVREDDSSWGSFYDVYQFQLTFLLMEQSFHEALIEVQAAKDDIEKNISALRDEMAAKIAATMFAATSVVYAEVMLFADAGGKINTRLQAAAKHYMMAENSLRYHQGVARALAQRHEMRLRELGTSGVFAQIPSNKVRSTSLDKFTLRR
jgi:hypothetical protein